MNIGFKKDADGDYIVKTPTAVLDYKRDWAAWLDGDTIANSAWDVPTGLTAGLATNDSTTATQWISGGTAGATYSVANHITTAAGRQEKFSFRVICKP